MHFTVRRDLMAAKDELLSREQIITQMRTELEVREQRISELEALMMSLRTEITNRDEIVSKLRIEVRDSGNVRATIEVYY